MNSLASPHQSSSSHRDADYKRILAASCNILEQTPPPSIREILGAYRSKGDGDRDMLLAMLNAKAAEDQRLASLASLQRSLLEAFHHTDLPQPSVNTKNGSNHYPTPSFTRSPHLTLQRPSRRTQRSRSPQRPAVQLTRDAPMSHYSEHPRKRHRSSRSPHSSHAIIYESHPSQHEQFPPSPYSSSDRSDSAEYSPRSRASMAIGSLLSSGPSRETNGDSAIQERE